MKIAINGGHYPGLDSGAVGASGLQEASVTCDIMKKTADYIRYLGHEVLEVQENELAQITNASNNFGAELFVSIHCNGAENKEARGTETYILHTNSNAERLARCIQKEIVGELCMVDRGVKTANFYVLRNTNCPAVLVETAFITNQCEELFLADGEMRHRFAAAIAQGVFEYICLQDKKEMV